MTVAFVGTIKRWQGHSDDIKPVDDVPEGSTFHNVDTGETFVFHLGVWEPDLRT